MCMLPIFSQWLSDSKTVFVSSLAIIFLVKVKILGGNGDFNGKWTYKLNILKKALSDGLSANLRPLYNSNVAKVSIVKWSQILISTEGSSISGIPKNVKNLLF